MKLSNEQIPKNLKDVCTQLTLVVIWLDFCNSCHFTSFTYLPVGSHTGGVEACCGLSQEQTDQGDSKVQCYSLTIL